MALLMATSLMTAACQHAPDTLRAARAHNLTPAQLEEVTATVAAAVDQPVSNVRSDAFATTHILVLEPSIGQSPQGSLATGTTTTRPPTFHLLSDGDRCLLEDQSTGIQYLLTFTCGPIPITDESTHND